MFFHHFFFGSNKRAWGEVFEKIESQGTTSVEVFSLAHLFVDIDNSYPLGSMYGIYLPTFTIRINQMSYGYWLLSFFETIFLLPGCFCGPTR